jgi:hypothetical protein
VQSGLLPHFGGWSAVVIMVNVTVTMIIARSTPAGRGIARKAHSHFAPQTLPDLSGRQPK